MEYDSHGTITQNTAGCMTSGCHTTMPDGFNEGHIQSQVQNQLDSLAVLLRKAGHHGRRAQRVEQVRDLLR